MPSFRSLLGFRPSGANRSLLRSHRTTARGVLFLLTLLLAGTAAAGPVPEPGGPPAGKPGKSVKSGSRLIFPVVGKAQYTDDFGQARGQGKHEGNDILASRGAPAVAVETGTVKFWTTSARAGCMLYLYGKSGTTYLYIHLNNDLTKGNDNGGKCVPGTAYAPGLKNGARVQAGQQVGYVGDSGDANGGPTHLHFEVHPNDGAASDPFQYLNSAVHLLFVAAPGKPFSLALRGSVSAMPSGLLQLRIESLRVWPGGLQVPDVKRTLSVKVPLTAVVEQVVNGISSARELGSSLAALRKGKSVVVWTLPAPATLDAQIGKNGTLSVDRVVLTAAKK